MKVFDKHFGKLCSLLLLIVIFVGNYNGLKISVIEMYNSFNNYLFIFISVLFFVTQYYLFKKNRMAYKIGLLILLFNLQALFISKFLDLVKLDNTRSDVSLLDKNAALSMSWIIIVPTLFFLFFTLGVIFDYISLKSRCNINK